MVMLSICGPKSERFVVPSDAESVEINDFYKFDVKPFLTDGITTSSSCLLVKLAPANYSMFDYIPEAFLHQVIFETARNAWQKESASMSSITQMSMLDSYQTIIAMGEKAFPFIFRQMQSEWPQPDMWFWALEKIALATGKKLPFISDEAIGDNQMIAKTWFEWADENAIFW